MCSGAHRVLRHECTDTNMCWPTRVPRLRASQHHKPVLPAAPQVAIIQSKRLRNKIAGFTTVSCDGRSRDAYGAAAGRSSDVWGASGSVEWQHSRAAVAGVAGSMRGGGSWN